MINSIDEYIEASPEAGKEWLKEFLKYMNEKYPEYNLIMFRQCPMYKFGKSYLEGYVMFTTTKKQFALHILDFEMIEEMKKKISKAEYGKGCIKVKYDQVESKPVLKEIIDRVMIKAKSIKK